MTLMRRQAFEWNVPNARNLKEFVESQNLVSTAASLHSDDSHASQGSGIPPVLRETPMVGDGKFKLEISRAVIDDTTSTTSGPVQTSDGTVTEPISITINSEARNPPALSLCLTSLQLDYDPECEITTTVMAGIKSSSDFTGQRGARTEWVWEMWDDFVFRKGSEFWGELDTIHSKVILMPFHRVHDAILDDAARESSHFC
jgi:hypothetical protein